MFEAKQMTNQRDGRVCVVSESTLRQIKEGSLSEFSSSVLLCIVAPFNSILICVILYIIKVRLSVILLSQLKV